MLCFAVCSPEHHSVNSPTGEQALNRRLQFSTKATPYPAGPASTLITSKKAEPARSSRDGCPQARVHRRNRYRAVRIPRESGNTGLSSTEYLPQTPVKQELVHRPGSLFWRSRRATAIKTGLMWMQADILCVFRDLGAQDGAARRRERYRRRTPIAGHHLGSFRKTGVSGHAPGQPFFLFRRGRPCVSFPPQSPLPRRRRIPQAFQQSPSDGPDSIFDWNAWRQRVELKAKTACHRTNGLRHGRCRHSANRRCARDRAGVEIGHGLRDRYCVLKPPKFSHLVRLGTGNRIWACHCEKAAGRRNLCLWPKVASSGQARGPGFACLAMTRGDTPWPRPHGGQAHSRWHAF
jgi:hypothetical protein